SRSITAERRLGSTKSRSASSSKSRTSHSNLSSPPDMQVVYQTKVRWSIKLTGKSIQHRPSAGQPRPLCDRFTARPNPRQHWPPDHPLSPPSQPVQTRGSIGHQTPLCHPLTARPQPAPALATRPANHPPPPRPPPAPPTSSP